MFLLSSIDQEEEELVDPLGEMHETCGLDIGLNTLRRLTTVHRYVPTKHTGETERRNQVLGYYADISLFFCIYCNRIFSYRMKFYPRQSIDYYRMSIAAVFVPQVKLYRSLAC